MLKHKNIFFHIKRRTAINTYITSTDLKDLINNLTTGELKLFSLLHESVLKNPRVDYFSTENLAKELDMSEKSILNAKAKLKSKGYVLLVKFRDETNEPCLRVIVGKDQVALYRLGIKVEITDSKKYKEIVDKYGLFTKEYDKETLNMIVDEINKLYN